MGGKRKQAQRTKNNARPSSSGRSAELLDSTFPQFVGFSGVKESSLVTSVFTLPSEDADTLVDSNFQLVFKKMNKKDSTTKLKALQEFTDLVKAAEVVAIKAILPFWPRLYCFLAIDSRHKVREATQLAHHQLVLKAKRNVAPYLKQLSGTWFVSQYDTYAPAASAASRAFQELFPHNKEQEAIIFCQEEILSYICDNLTIQTPQTLSGVQASSEDSELKYQRIIQSSLNGYALYLNKVPCDQIEKFWVLNVKMIADDKFWNLSKNKVPPIRAAWFVVLATLFQKVPHLMDKGSAYIAVFSNLDESQPTVLPRVWEAALSILSLVEEWWKYVNIDKLVLPKLYKVLKDGGNGNAAVIFPNLLPLISQVSIITDENVFYPTFFENMRNGLKTTSVIQSRSEFQAVSVAFIECLQYVIMKKQSDTALCEKLIKTQLYPLLEWSFNDTQECYKNLYNQVAKLPQFWDRNHIVYEKYLTYFWQNLESLYLGLLLNLSLKCEVTPTQLASKQFELVMSLKHLTKNKRLLKVRFNSEEQEEAKQDTLVDFSETYLTSLNKVVYKTCEAYVSFTNEKRSKDLIEHLLSLITNFDSDSFFRQFNVEESSFCVIYRQLLLKWLNDDLLCSKAVVDLIFILFKYFNFEEKMEVLAEFCKLSNKECLGWCVTQALSHPNIEDPVILKWLCNETVHQFLIKIAEKKVSNTSTPELNLILKQAFTENADEDLIISKETVLEIIKILICPLNDPISYSKTLDACASFVAYISAVIYTSHFKLMYGDEVLLSLFTLSNSIVSEDILYPDTYWEVDTAWQDAVTLLSQEVPFTIFKEMALKCSTIIVKTHNEKSIELVTNFIKIVANNSPLWLQDIIMLFLKHDFIDKWSDGIYSICEQAEYTRGNLYIDHIINYESTIHEDNIEKYFEWMDLVVSVLIKPLEEETKEFWSHLRDLIQQECEIFILDLFSALTLGGIFIRNYKCVKPCQYVGEILPTFHKKFNTLLENFTPDYLKSIETLLLQKQKGDSWLWTVCLYNYKLQTKGSNISNVYTDILNESIDTSKKLHLTQTWAKHITYDQIWDNLTLVERIIVLRCIIYKPELEVQIAEAFAVIERFKRENHSDYVYRSGLQWQNVELITEIMRLFSGIVRFRRDCVQIHRWDFILTSFVTWCENITKSLSNTPQIRAMILALSELFVSITNYIEECDNLSIKTEWKDIFAQDVHSRFLEIWCYYAGHYQAQTRQSVIVDLPFLDDFVKVVNSSEISYIFSKTCSVKWFKLLSQSCTLLTHQVTTLQLWGYHILLKLVSGLVKIDATAVSNNTPHENGLIIEQFKTTLVHTQEIVQSMLLEFRLGDDSCRVEPFTDSYTYTFAYLLLWDVLLYLCERSTPELRYQYSDWLRKEDFVGYLLVNLFKLIPLEMETRIKPYSDWFVTKCALDFTEAPTSQLIERMVCWIYASTVTQLPVLVRQWWCNQESRVTQLVERITSTFVSSHLCNQELAALTNHIHKFKNMTIKTHPTAREVVAIYTVDEVQVELLITLPNNYPLVGPDVRCNKQILGTSHRQWLLQLRMCVLHQDGRIWDGLLLWNNNLDKRFDGVEECYICFSVIHQGTYQIPRLSCQTCKKKFHSACLYKWFSTSNKSSCPVCRNLF